MISQYCVYLFTTSAQNIKTKQNILSIDMPGEWGVIYENATGDGVIGAVVERRAEIGLTALYSW